MTPLSRPEGVCYRLYCHYEASRKMEEKKTLHVLTALQHTAHHFTLSPFVEKRQQKITAHPSNSRWKQKCTVVCMQPSRCLWCYELVLMGNSVFLQAKTPPLWSTGASKLNQLWKFFTIDWLQQKERNCMPLEAEEIMKKCIQVISENALTCKAAAQLVMDAWIQEWSEAIAQYSLNVIVFSFF